MPALAAREEGLYTVLMAHRPERFADYAAHPIDLVAAGHAHGGQWRIPLLLDGLYAPNQGFFPDYTSGVHVLEGTSMVVGRGVYLEERVVPRIFNRPEVVVIRLEPEA